MAIHDAGMFTVKGINRLKILQDAIDRNLHPGQAAEMLGITPRHCRRLLKRYRQLGPLGMNNHSRGRVDSAPKIVRGHLNFAGRRTFLLSLDNNDGGRKAAPSVNQSYNQQPALADAMSIPIVKSGT